MRRHAAFLLPALVLAVASPAQGNDPHDEARAAIVESRWFEDRLPPIPPRFGPEQEQAPDLSTESEPGALELTKALRTATVRLRASAFRVRRNGGEAGSLLASDRALLSETDLHSIRGAVDGGHLEPLASVSLTGRLGAAISGSSRDVSPVLTRHDIECAIGIAVAWPQVAQRREGLEVHARVAPHTNGNLVLAFHAALSAGVTATPVETSTGDRDSVGGTAFVASGSAIVPAAGALCIRGMTPTGEGFVVLLSTRGENIPRLPRPLDKGWVALPLAASSMKFNSAVGLVDRDETAQADGLVKWGARFRRQETASAHALVEELAGNVERWVPGPAGVTFVQTRPDESDAIVSRFIAEHASPDVTTVVARHPSAGRIVIPALPGDAPRGFLGRVRTRSSGIDVETGCHRCIQVADWIEMGWEGLAFAAAIRRDRLAEIDLAVRTVHASEHRNLPARRILSTHDRYEYDDVLVRFTTDSEMRVRSLLPRGGGALPDGANCDLIGQGAIDEPVRTLTVNAEPVHVVPGYTARVLRQRYTPHLLTWEWEGSCAMTYRYPTAHHVADGMDVAVRLRGDGDEIDVAGTLTGAPVTVHPDFDMGDGTVEIKRRPYMAVTSRIGAGAVRRVAWAGDLALDVGVAGSDARSPLRTARVDIGDDEHGVRFLEGTRVTLDGGGVTLIPARLGHYQSNHSTGEAYVDSPPVLDGVALELRGFGEMMRGYADLRTRPTLRAYSLHKRESPRRPETDVNLLQPTRAQHTWPLFVPNGRTLDRTSATGTPPLRVSVATATTEDEDRR